jgi:SH3 domain protein
MLIRLRQKRAAHPAYSNPFLLLVCLGAVLFSTTLLKAENLYVKPSTEVPIRSGQGTEYKILSVVPDGLMVELLEEDESWARVRTPGGTEGWMLKRYLSSEPPLSEIVENLRTRSNELAAKEEETSRRYDELAAAYTQMEQEYNACLAERDELREKYLLLQQDTADVVRIKNNLEKADRKVNEVMEELAAVQQENDNLKNSIAVKWFMAGGGVLLLGWLIGMMTGRSRKRRSSLY